MGSLRRVRWVCTFLVGLGACGPGDAFPGGTEVSFTPPAPDRVLERPELQRVVDLQTRRDGAALRALFLDADPTVRERAAVAMASVRDLGAAPELRALLADPDARVRAAAAFALAHYSGAGDGGDQMTELLAGESDRDVRDAMIHALGKAGYSRSLSVLLRLDGADRAAATLALSRAVIRESAPAGAVDTLVARLTDPDAQVRRNAAYFMERVADPDVWVNYRIPIRTALDQMALDDPAALSLVKGLGGRMDVFSLPRIVFRARNASDWRVRSNAMAALDGMGLGLERTITLIDGLDDGSPHVQVEAATVLSTSPPEPDVEARLVDWVARNPRALAAMGPVLFTLAQAENETVVLDWVSALEPDDVEGWAVGIRALNAMPGAAAVEELLRATRSSHVWIARPAAAALVDRMDASMGFGAESALVDLLGRGVEHGNVAVVPTLASALADPALLEVGGAARLVTAYRSTTGADAMARRSAIFDVLESLDPAISQDLFSEIAAAGPAPLARRARAALEAAAAASTTDTIEEPAPTSVPARGSRPAPEIDWVRLAELGSRPRLILETDVGTVVMVLATDQAPLSVQGITDLAREGAFDGVPFHRVVSNFVVQTGDLSRGDHPGASVPRLRTEITRIPFARGVVGMARGNALDSEGSQFFLTHGAQPHLDGEYTAFGWVVSGMDVVDRITQAHRIRRARVVADG